MESAAVAIRFSASFRSRLDSDLIANPVYTTRYSLRNRIVSFYCVFFRMLNRTCISDSAEIFFGRVTLDGSPAKGCCYEIILYICACLAICTLNFPDLPGWIGDRASSTSEGNTAG